MDHLSFSAENLSAFTGKYFLNPEFPEYCLPYHPSCSIAITSGWQRQHLQLCVSDRVTTGGSWALQIFMAYLQRSTNAQPWAAYAQVRRTAGDGLQFALAAQLIVTGRHRVQQALGVRMPPGKKYPCPSTSMICPPYIMIMGYTWRLPRPGRG